MEEGLPSESGVMGGGGIERKKSENLGKEEKKVIVGRRSKSLRSG